MLCFLSHLAVFGISTNGLIWFFLFLCCRLLSRRDLEVVVENGTPFLFRNGDDSARRMRLFLSQGDTHVSF